jgi:hypothetical protein
VFRLSLAEAGVAMQHISASLIPLLGRRYDILGGRNGVMLSFGFRWALGK